MTEHRNSRGKNNRNLFLTKSIPLLFIFCFHCESEKGREDEEREREREEDKITRTHKIYFKRLGAGRKYQRKNTRGEKMGLKAQSSKLAGQKGIGSSDRVTELFGVLSLFFRLQK